MDSVTKYLQELKLGHLFERFLEEGLDGLLLARLAKRNCSQGPGTQDPQSLALLVLLLYSFSEAECGVGILQAWRKLLMTSM